MSPSASSPTDASSASSATRVCVIVENHWRAVMGGAPYQGRVIAECLAARPDLAVYYLARRCLEDEGSDPYRVIRIGGSTGIRRRAVFFDAPDLWRALRTIDPAVIYQRMRQSYTAVAALYARRHSKRFVFHAASDYDVMPGRFRKHWSLNTPFDWAEGALGEYGMRRASAIVTQTQRQADLLRANFDLEAAAVVPNMHPEPAPHAPLAKSPAEIQIAWIANFKRVKRPEYFVHLAEELADLPARFIMAGRPGSSRHYGALHDRIRSLPNVDYVGELTHERVNELLSRCDFLVNTSVTEGFSNTFIQAWMRRTVVVSMSVDMDETLASGQLGYLAGSYERLRDLLRDLCARRDELGALRDRALAHALEHFSTRRMDRLLDVMQIVPAQTAKPV